MIVEHNQVPQAVLNAVQALGIPLDKCQFVNMDAEDTAGVDSVIKERGVIEQDGVPTGVGTINYGDLVRCVSDKHPTFDDIIWPVTVGLLYEVVESLEGTPCIQMNNDRHLHLNNFSFEPISEDRELAPAGQIDASAVQALFRAHRRAGAGEGGGRRSCRCRGAQGGVPDQARCHLHGKRHPGIG